MQDPPQQTELANYEVQSYIVIWPMMDVFECVNMSEFEQIQETPEYRSGPMIVL